MLSLAIIQIQHKLGEFQESKLILQVSRRRLQSLYF